MIPLYLPSSLFAADKKAIEEIGDDVSLMGMAAQAMHSSICYPEGNILFLAGKGNNGGDAFAMALLAKFEGRDVSIVTIDGKFTKTSLFYLDLCIKNNIDIKTYDESFDFSAYKTIVDGIFGIGFHGDLDEKSASVIQKVNDSDAYIISIDCPSGLNLESGVSRGGIKADLTLSVSGRKPGYYLNDGLDVCGEVRDIYIPTKPDNEIAYLIENSDAKSVFKPRKHNSNKGTYGYVGIIAGSSLYPGASKLSALGLAALRLGCGVSKLIVPASIAPYLYPEILETTLLPMEEEDGQFAFEKETWQKAIAGLKAVAIGPGIGTNGKQGEILRFLLEQEGLKLVIDADAINFLSKLKDIELANVKAQVILTPHPKEFSRLNGLEVEEILSNPLKHAIEYAKNNDVILLLKGPATIITDGETTYISSSGTPGMATAGSGDVLTGALVGMLGSDGDTLKQVAVTAYIVGKAGEKASEKVGDISLTSGDTLKEMPTIIQKLMSE